MEELVVVGLAVGAGLVIADRFSLMCDSALRALTQVKCQIPDKPKPLAPEKTEVERLADRHKEVTAKMVDEQMKIILTGLEKNIERGLNGFLYYVPYVVRDAVLKECSSKGIACTASRTSLDTLFWIKGL